MDSVDQAKLICIFVFVVISCLCSFIPYWLRSKNSPAFLPFANALSCGFFLGAAVIHLLPESERFFTAAGEEITFFKAYTVFSSVLAVVGFWLMLAAEKGLVSRCGSSASEGKSSNF